MTTTFWSRAAELFEAAHALPAEERARFLKEACSGDARLHEEVLSLLASHDSAPGVIEGVIERVRSAPAAALREPSRVGQTLGPYRITRLLDSGGMGAVYAAVRADDVYEMQVAIKLIRGGLLDPGSEERFNRERQVLRMLAGLMSR